jgi:6-pyruvoyltetrahydropterin/6-carboxytetrahydropterin synthase
MYKVTKTIHFCYGHRLRNYRGRCRYLHGHNGKVEIELSANRLDRRGMVRDFDDIKRAIQRWIDAHLDHKMVLQRDDPALPALRKLNEPYLVVETNPTAETLAKLIYDVGRRLGFPVTAVRLWETDRSFATYQPAANAPDA